MSTSPLYLCETHKKKFAGYCESCNLNICLLCTSKHENHELLQYNEIQPSNKKVEEIKKQFIQYKKQNKLLKEKLQSWLEKINYFTNKIQEILENNEKVYESILSNYDTNNLIYSEIDSMNQIKKKGLILGYKNINLDLFSTDEKILDNSDLIMKTIKEMEKEEIFFKIKEQKNIFAGQNISNIVKNKNEEDKKEKKVIKKKKKKKSNAPKKVEEEKKDDNKENQKETENELMRKKFEELKEINLKSKLFDSDYLINLDKSKSEENFGNKFDEQSSTNLYKSVSNGREINHVCMVSFDNIKYIVTTGYCYINLFDLKGDLQRAIKIHESDITYLVQMKNNDLLTCSIDSTMKIIRLGKNEGYNVIQTIDTSKVKNENNNSIFSNKQLYVVLQINSNENIITTHGSNILFYTQTKENKDLYEFNQILSYNNKNENEYEMIIHSNSISSLIEITNDNFVGLNNNTVLFFEKENKESNKYMINDEIKGICGTGGPNNIIYFDNKIIIGGGNNIYIINVNEKKILKEIKINCCGINCLNINKNNDKIYIGYETKENGYEISENNIIKKENEIEIKLNKVMKKPHIGSISNIVPLEEKDIIEPNIKLSFVSGAHDKYLKFWN